MAVDDDGGRLSSGIDFPKVDAKTLSTPGT